MRTGNPINLERAKISSAVNHREAKIMEEEILVSLKRPRIKSRIKGDILSLSPFCVSFTGMLSNPRAQFRSQNHFLAMGFLD